MVESPVPPSTGKNLYDKMNPIFYGAGAVTKPKRLAENLSLPLRAARAAIVEAVGGKEVAVAPENFTRIKNEYGSQIKDLRRLTKELYHHNLYEVTTNYGELGGQISILNPEQTDIPPLVFISGSSTDPENSESVAVELALQTKRKVVLIGYPDAPNGKTSEEFTTAVVEDMSRPKRLGEQFVPTYLPYVEFFDAQLKTLTEKGIIPEQFDLVGYSAGSAISAKLLSSGEYSARVNNALILNPGGSSTTSDSQFALGGIAQGLVALTDGKNFPRSTWWDDPRNAKVDIDKKRKHTSWTALINGSHYQIPDWQTARVKDGGKIVVYSGGKDYGTRSYDTFTDTKKPENDQMTVLYDPNAHHTTIGTNPERVIRQLRELLTW